MVLRTSTVALVVLCILFALAIIILFSKELFLLYDEEKLYFQHKAKNTLNSNEHDEAIYKPLIPNSQRGSHQLPSISSYRDDETNNEFTDNGIQLHNSDSVLIFPPPRLITHPNPNPNPNLNNPNNNNNRINNMLKMHCNVDWNVLQVPQRYKYRSIKALRILFSLLPPSGSGGSSSGGSGGGDDCERYTSSRYSMITNITVIINNKNNNNDNNSNNNNDEKYSLDIDHINSSGSSSGSGSGSGGGDGGSSSVESGVSLTITTTTLTGLYNSIGSIVQVVTSPATTTLPLHITDYPDYSWRGVMIDVARHYIPLPSLLRVIDGMLITRLNTLHLHLTDAQSFPVVLQDEDGLPLSKVSVYV